MQVAPTPYYQFPGGGGVAEWLRPLVLAHGGGGLGLLRAITALPAMAL